jgi:hypothetical protein
LTNSYLLNHYAVVLQQYNLFWTEVPVAVLSGEYAGPVVRQAPPSPASEPAISQAA